MGRRGPEDPSAIRNQSSKVYRAITLALMILLALLLVVAMTAYGVSTFSGGSLIALIVVVVAAAAAGIAFSYKRYFPRRR